MSEQLVASNKKEVIDETPINVNGQSNSRINYAVNVGDKDINGYEIKHVYSRMLGNYLIYRIDGDDIRVVSRDASVITRNPDFNKLWMQIKEYLALAPTLKKTYAESLAHAVKYLYDGRPEDACFSLSTTHESIIRNLKRRAVIPYILGAFCTVSISLIAYFFAYYSGKLSYYENMMFSAVVLSSLGGLLSVGISLSDIKVDIQNTPKNQFIYGLARIIIAMISGVIVYYLIEGNIALTFLKNTQNINTYYIAFFVAGFSEKLVSNTMLSFEMKDKKDSEAK